MSSQSSQPVDRRTLIQSVGALGVGVVGAGALAACSSADSASNDNGGGTGAGAAGGAVTLQAGTVPVGGGTIIADRLVVVTQPTAGEFKAFSATCTHQQCTVTKVENGKIVCPCHDSHFDITTGAPTADSKAKSPLPARTATVSGDTITVA